MDEAWIKKQLRRQEDVQTLARFDVKEGQDGKDAAPYYETYLNEAVEAMGDHFPCPGAKWDDLTPWQRLCCFKITGTKGVDCDAALRSTVIYQLVLGGGVIMPKGKICLLQRDRVILRGDTMNSYAKTVREYIRKIWLPEHESEMLGSGIIKKDGGDRKVSKKYQDMSDKNYWDAAILDNYDYFKDILPEAANEFFRLYHTVGNFIPWPNDCNKPRGTGATMDYWDLCLQYIYQWYQDNPAHVGSDALNHDALEKLVGQHKDALGNWLSTFDSWDEFVEKNYMQDFVNQTVGGGYGEPKELWTGHFTKGVMPKTKTDFEQFFTNASSWIAARGLRIARAVQAALAAEEPGTA